MGPGNFSIFTDKKQGAVLSGQSSEFLPKISTTA